MSEETEIVFNWRKDITRNQGRMSQIGRLDVGVNQGNFIAVIDQGAKVIVDATGTDGGATLVTVDGKGLLELGDMFPAEVQARRDEEGRFIEPQYVARIKTMSIEFELEPAREDDLSRLKEFLSGE